MLGKCSHNSHMCNILWCIHNGFTSKYVKMSTHKGHKEGGYSAEAKQLIIYRCTEIIRLRHYIQCSKLKHNCQDYNATSPPKFSLSFKPQASLHIHEMLYTLLQSTHYQYPGDNGLDS